MSSSKKTMFASALVAFALSIGATISIGPSTAWAQTATDLDCKKCVRGKALKNGAVKFNRLQGKVQNRITSLESATTALQSTTSALEAIAMERVPFYVTLDGDGTEQTIATNGPLTYSVRCTVDAITDEVEIIGTSSQAGWFGVGENDTISNGLVGEEMGAADNTSGAATADFDNDIDESFMVAPEGSYLAIDGETLALGLNVFGHDCIAVGNVFVITGTP